MKRNKESYLFNHGDVQVPLEVHYEIRDNIRISIGRSKANLRLPLYMRPSRKRAEIEKAKEWLAFKLTEKPEIAKRFRIKPYRTGDIMEVSDRQYILDITYRPAKTNSGSLKGQTIFLRLNPESPPLKIKQLLSRIIAQEFLPDIQDRVHHLNERFFQKTIQSVKLKYNRSNWGSCSSSGNINLSTRLLFAPDEVIDYVIIHELAHFIEMNHSKKFYSIVRDVMPTFREKEKWLKEHGHLCDF